MAKYKKIRQVLLSGILIFNLSIEVGGWLNFQYEIIHVLDCLPPA